MFLLYSDSIPGTLLRAANPYALPGFITVIDQHELNVGCIITAVNFKATLNVALSVPLTGLPYFYVLSAPPAIVELEGIAGRNFIDWGTKICLERVDGISGVFRYSWEHSAANLHRVFRLRIYKKLFFGFITDFTFTVGREAGYLSAFRMNAVMAFDRYLLPLEQGIC